MQKWKCIEMNFFEAVAEDLIYFFDEFSTPHKIDNQTLNVIVDTNELREKQKEANHLITEASTLIYVKTAEIEQKQIGDSIIFDNRVKIIEQWNEMDGITEIILSDNGGYL